jgi:outer membrane lipoprotein carrier protein
MHMICFSYRMASLRRIVAGVGLVAGVLLALPSWADGLDSLARFLRDTHSGTAHFTQIVTTPPRSGQAHETPRQRTQNGVFAFERPGQFRFDYQAPFAQTIVADGKTLWLYDADLNQVTSRPQTQMLASTPAALIATARDLQALQRDYVLTDEGEQSGEQWVKAVPKPHDDGTSGALQSVRVGLKTGADGAPALATLDILDSFGQRSQITFSAFQTNATIPPARFQFTPPKGADVIKE